MRRSLRVLAAAGLALAACRELLDERRALRARHDDVNAAIRRAAPELRDPRPVDVRGARAALDPGTLMLSYSVGEERTDLFVVARDLDLQVETLAAGDARLRRDVEEIRGLLEPAVPGSAFGERELRDASAPYYWAAFQVFGDRR